MQLLFQSVTFENMLIICFYFSLKHWNIIRLRKMRRIVDETVVRGVATSRAFQQALLADPQVQRGEFDTRYLESDFLPRWLDSLPATE